MGFVGTAVLENYAFVSVFEDFKLKYADLGRVEIELKRCGYSSSFGINVDENNLCKFCNVRVPVTRRLEQL